MHAFFRPFLRFLARFGPLVVAFASVASANPTLSNSITLDLRDTAAITIGDLEQTYAAAPRVPSVQVTPAGTPFTITYGGSTVPPVNAGSYSVVVTVDSATRVGRAEATLVVGKALLTVFLDERRLQGFPHPPLRLSYSGFQGDDDASVLDEAPGFIVNTNESSPAGDYSPIFIPGGDADYDLFFESGRVRIVPLAGSYEALLRDESGLPFGRLSLILTRTAFSGQLMTFHDASSFPLRGRLAVDTEAAVGHALVEIRRRGLASYVLGFEAGEGLSVTLSDQDGLLAATEGDEDGVRLAAFTARAPAPWAGRYSLVMSDPREIEASGRDHPAGAGHATTLVNAAGLMTASGLLADGTRFTGAFRSGILGSYRLFARSHGSRAGSGVAGVIALRPHPQRSGRHYVPSSEGQDVYWAKGPRSTDRSYSAGFGPLGLALTLDPWQAPLARNVNLPALLGLDSTDFVQSLGSPAQDAISSRGVPSDLRFTNANRILPVAVNNSAWSAVFAPSTGAFRGSYRIIDTVNVGGRVLSVRRNVNFSGILRQGPDGDQAIMGRGFFLLPPLPGGGGVLSGDLRFGGEASGTVRGRVTDGLVGGGVGDVTLAFETASGTPLAQTSTDSTGNYELTLPTGVLTAQVSRAGYVGTTLNVTVPAGQTVEADLVLFAPQRSGTGTIQGRVVNAFDASGVGGATVRLRSGVNDSGGTVLQTVTSNSSGQYSFVAAGGSYTVEATAAGFGAGTSNVVAVGGELIANQDLRLTPGLNPGEIRVVLSWGSTPSDLDSHLAGPASGGGRFHVYYGTRAPAGSSAELDVDDTSSYGPETITLSALRAGTYRYWIHDYSNGGSASSTALSQQSGARVVVYRGTGSGTTTVATFNVPSGRAGNAWVVFDLDGTTGAITPVNLVTSVAGASSIP